MHPFPILYEIAQKSPQLFLTICFAGYGFVDFDSPAAAQKAVTALKSTGVQAQMAKVRTDHLIFDPSTTPLASKFPCHCPVETITWSCLTLADVAKLALRGVMATCHLFIM